MTESKLEKIGSNVGHAALASSLWALVWLPLHAAGIAHASWIAFGFPVGVYFGRETLDNARNYYEALKGQGMSGEEAREIAQG